MATPYLQIRRDEVASTQDLARSELGDLPIVVIAQRQTAGRGRSGAEWLNATRALAVSLALRVEARDTRPFSLMAGVAAGRVLESIYLKWPNDLLVGTEKAGGILVERSEGVMAVGVGLNLWWPDRPAGFGQVYPEDPGLQAHAEIAGLWAAEMMRIVDGPGWPADEYRSLCVTIGLGVSWDPEGSGRAIGVDDDGGLIVDTGGATRTLVAGAISHVRG